MKENFSHKILRVLRKIYSKLHFFNNESEYSIPKFDPDHASELIFNMLSKPEPCMIARYGAFELASVVNCLAIKAGRKDLLKFIQNRTPAWWWMGVYFKLMENNAGFFPANPETIRSFTNLMVNDSKEVDILGSWRKDELYVKDLITNSISVHLLSLEPYFAKHPWTMALKGKKVLVIHPFAELINTQYQKRNILFDNPNVLPDFQIKVMKAVQTITGEKTKYSNWFEALDAMKAEIETIDFDIALIGCGAYGFPLAAHVKRLGKKAIHLGGALQLLFGIKGKRWEDPNYAAEWGLKPNLYSDLINHEGWCRPTENLKPVSSVNVENGCYW